VDTGFDAEVERISLKKNYRSAERILDISEESLLIEGSGTESLDREAVREGITSLEAVMEYENPEVSGFVSEDEKLALLSRIQEVVRDDGYMIDGENISFGDIAVITRTKKFGLELEKKAREYGIPVAFEGGVELFRTDPGKILLAWLRIVSGLEEKRGWSVVLDRAGHSPGQITRILDSGDYPNDMEEFMKDLEGSKPSRIAQEVFDRYGIDNGFTTKIISVLSKLGSTADDVIGFMEHCIENGTEFEVDDSRGSDLVTIRTVHRSKGLEYPAVFIPDINDSHFPSRNSDFSPLEFSFETGLRQRKKFDPDRNCIVDSWKSRILSSSFPTEYDEERRLFYVAMTRAKKYLFLSAEKGNESPFFRKMDIEKCEIESEPEKMSGVKESREKLKIPSASGRRPRKISAHHFIDTGKITGEGRGTEFGTKVHEFAESIINGGVHEVGDERDFRNTERFLGQLEGDIRAEVPILLPLETEDRKYTVEGIIDLLVVYDERVSIVDFKTDTSKEMEDEYRKQLSVYYHAIREIFPEKDVEISVFYTYFGEKKVQEPIDRESLKDLIEL